ncbi:MAG: hypothetical protein WCH99_00125 [Verrucomicrobiota bacterium]
MENKHPELVMVTEWFGHTLTYMRKLWPYFLERGVKIYHVTNQPDQAARFAAAEFPAAGGMIEHIGLDQVRPVANRSGDSWLAEVEAYWAGVGATLQKLSTRLGRRPGVFHTWIDLKSHPFLENRVIAEALPGPTVGLCVHPAELRIYKSRKRRLYEGLGHLRRYGRFRESRLRAIKVPGLRCLYLLDEMLVPQVARLMGPGIAVRAFPEPVEVAVEELPLPRLCALKAQGFQVVCVVGFLHKRKGILNLIRTAKMNPKKWAFLFAGPLDHEGLSDTELAEVKDWCAQPPANCVLQLTSLSDAQVNSVIRQSDLVFLAYENFFHSSNVQIKAAIFDKLIIAGPRHLISERTQKFQLGWCLADHSPATLARLLQRLDSSVIAGQQAQANFDGLADEHSVRRLETCLAEVSGFLGL